MRGFLTWGALYTATSLGSCAVALCLQLFYTDHLVKIEDWSALLATSLAAALVPTLLVVAAIVLNVIALFVYFGKNQEADSF